MESNQEIILTDLEMTNRIVKHFRSDKRFELRNEWLEFTEQTFDEKNRDKNKFIIEVNQWLKKHKIPIHVLNFEAMDTDIGGTDWTIGEIDWTICPN